MATCTTVGQPREDLSKGLGMSGKVGAIARGDFLITSIMLVLPWLVLPSPVPSFQPIFCSILFPLLLESMALWGSPADSFSFMAAR